MSISYDPSRKGMRGLPDDIRIAIEDRFAKIEEKLQRNQQQSSRWQEDSVKRLPGSRGIPDSGAYHGDGEATDRGNRLQLRVDQG